MRISFINSSIKSQIVNRMLTIYSVRHIYRENLSKTTLFAPHFFEVFKDTPLQIYCLFLIKIVTLRVTKIRLIKAIENNR